MKTCNVCNKFIDQEEADHVWELLDELSIEEFGDVITCMGLEDEWESAIICETCFEYYQ